MKHTIAEIALALDAEAVGETGLTVKRLSEPQKATPDALALATNPDYAAALQAGTARAALLWSGADWQDLGLAAAIIPRRPRFAMSRLTAIMDPGQRYPKGIHPQALVDPTAELDEDVSVGPFAVIGAGAKLGRGTIVGPQCYIGADSVMGADCYLREQVSIGAHVIIGDRFIAQPGARIGGDGFSFVTEDKSTIENVRETLGDAKDAKAQPWHRIHSLGGVQIGDDVEIGANSAVDSGTIRPTSIGSGTKIDNLVQIGHNDVIGRNCLICGHVGIAGSVTIGDNVILAGKVGVNDNIKIGDNVVAGGAAKIFTNVPAGRSVLGNPATKMETQVAIYKAIRRLPRILSDVTSLKKAVFKDDPTD